MCGSTRIIEVEQDEGQGFTGEAPGFTPPPRGLLMHESPACYIDQTLLRPDTTADEIARLCEEAVEHSFASVCVPPVFVGQCRELLYGSGVRLGTVVGFPFGYESPRIKGLQTSEAVRSGAEEIDMVISLGAARAGDLNQVVLDIRQVVAAAEARPVKAILECCLFDAPVKRRLVEALVMAGAAYVKTSTGFAAGGATVQDVALLADVARGRVKVKAAGGIRDWTTCAALLAAGAERIGTSSGVRIVQQWRQQAGLGG